MNSDAIVRDGIELDSAGLFEHALVGIYQTSLDRRFIAANQAMADILGYVNPKDLIESITDIKKQLFVHPTEWAAGGASQLRGSERQMYRARQGPGESWW